MIYTVEVTNRFKGLDLINPVPNELWTEVPDIVQEIGIKTIPKEWKCKKGKMVVWIIKIFFVQFFCVFLPSLLNVFCFC